MVSKFLPWIFVFCCCCNNINSENTIAIPPKQVTPANVNPYNKIVQIPLPEGFSRKTTEPSSFSGWLEDIALKKDKTVFTFNGTPKINQGAQFAVLDVSIGHTDLQQCADAVMRLRAEFLFKEKEYNKIIFNDNDGTVYQLHEPFTRQHFDRYLEQVFGMCGSASLARQMQTHVQMDNIEAGDVLIHGGFPGHAVIVMDVAENDQGKKIYLLAQSYMPAQDIHVLLNPANKKLSPWYEVNDDTIIETPEYTFTKYELRKW